MYDTGSDWLVVGSAAECDICDLDAYDTARSTSFEKIPNSDYNLQYGSSFVEGYLANDLVCTMQNLSSCTKM